MGFLPSLPLSLFLLVDMSSLFLTSGDLFGLLFGAPGLSTAFIQQQHYCADLRSHGGGKFADCIHKAAALFGPTALAFPLAHLQLHSPTVKQAHSHSNTYTHHHPTPTAYTSSGAVRLGDKLPAWELLSSI